MIVLDGLILLLRERHIVLLPLVIILVAVGAGAVDLLILKQGHVLQLIGIVVGHIRILTQLVVRQLVHILVVGQDVVVLLIRKVMYVMLPTLLVVVQLPILQVLVPVLLLVNGAVVHMVHVIRAALNG